MDEQKLEALLQAAWYRHDCPEVVLLGDYQLGRLAPAERNQVRLHLEHCPHCQAFDLRATVWAVYGHTCVRRAKSSSAF